MTMRASLLEASGVTVRTGHKALLHNASLSVRAGEKIALIGPNGAGKSTMLRALAGELRPSSGTIRLKGRDVAGYSTQALALHRAVLSQSVTVAFPFTVAEVVAMGAGDRGGAWVDTLVATALAQVDLTDFADRVITTLSGGEQQRAHLARVLVQLACGEAAHGPGMLLLDEPTASLDLRHQIAVIETLGRSAARGVTIIAVLHDLNLATLFAERIVVLDRGRIAADGPPRDTVTDAILERVFGIAASIGRHPPPGVPFILPHMMAEPRLRV
jgi:iron complex transport system ATP-binding protein